MLDQKAQLEYSVGNNTNVSYTEEKNDAEWKYIVPISKFLVTQETRNINRIYPKDLIEYSSFDNTLSKSIAQGFDSIDHTDLLPENDNRTPTRIQNTGISVPQSTDCNPFTVIMMRTYALEVW